APAGRTGRRLPGARRRMRRDHPPAPRCCRSHAFAGRSGACLWASVLIVPTAGRRALAGASSPTFTRTRHHFHMARVLVVDDEPAVRRALERALRLDNHEVMLAADGEQALDALADQPADAVILDILMPKLDGLEVCRRLRKAGDRTPVLMLTARDAIDDRVEGLDVGADDYLVKPFALRELQARLRALLRRAGDGASEGETLRYADLVL